MSDEVYDRRVPPHSEVSEQSVLGAMMLSKKAVLAVMDSGLSGRDFYLPKHELIFDAIAALQGRSEPVDPLTVTDEMETSGSLSKAGGAVYLHTLTSIVPTAASAGYYADIVADKAAHRRLVEAGTRIVQMGYASEGDVTELIDQARGEVEQIGTVTVTKATSMRDDAIQVLEAHRKHVASVPSPWAEVNAAIGGFAPGRVYTFGARPGAGKSALASQIAYALAADGPVVFATMEMDKGELYSRIVSQQAEVYYGALTAAAPMSEFMQAKQDAFLRTGLRDIRVLDQGTQTVASIRATVRSALQDGPVAGVIVDYVHLLSTSRPMDNEVQRIGDLMRALKLMAMDLKVPVIALSQLNRQGADGDRPSMQNLRGSGAIEQDSDVIVFLYRDPAEQSEFRKTVQVFVSKNRQGPNNVGFSLAWLGEFVKAVDL